VTEAELRALIRESVARHLGAGEESGDRPSLPPARPALSRRPAAPAGDHPSHAIYITLSAVGDQCLIEPGVTCNHCGYCKTHGF